MGPLGDRSRPRAPETAIAAWGGLLVAMTVLAYTPALRAGFVWDDDVDVTANPLVTEPGRRSRLWFSTEVPSQCFSLV